MNPNAVAEAVRKWFAETVNVTNANVEAYHPPKIGQVVGDDYPEGKDESRVVARVTVPISDDLPGSEAIGDTFQMAFAADPPSDGNWRWVDHDIKETNGVKTFEAHIHADS